MKKFNVGEMGVGKMGQIIGKMGVGETGVGEIGLIPTNHIAVSIFVFSIHPSKKCKIHASRLNCPKVDNLINA